MDMLKIFINEKITSWKYYEYGANIPHLEAHQQPPVTWKVSRLLANGTIQAEMLITMNFIENKIKSIITDEPIQSISHAIKHMETLLQFERLFQLKLEEISKCCVGMTSVICYKRGLIHLLEQRRQILEELEANGMKELKEKLTNSEKCINEYWAHRI